jgi:hypothetical protein
MARKQTREMLYRNGTLQNDNVYVNPTLEDVQKLTGIETRKGREKFIIVDVKDKDGNSKRQIVNNVSKDYGMLRNEDLYPMIEERLDGIGIGYKKRSVNRNSRSFVVDYVLDDSNMHVNVKGVGDKIKPMIRIPNSYDGSEQSAGHFGFFREICSNGLHIAQMDLKFKQRHRGNVIEIIMPKIEDLIESFMNNEYYSLHKKFEVLAETPISNLEQFVKFTLGETGLFKYAKSEKNPDEASLGAQFIIDTISNEAKELKTAPNLWLGYNAFNEYIHTQNEKVFMLQERADRKLFDAILEQVN